VLTIQVRKEEEEEEEEKEDHNGGTEGGKEAHRGSLFAPFRLSGAKMVRHTKCGGLTPSHFLISAVC